MLIQEQIPLAASTTLAVRGPARYFCEAHSEANVCDALVFARERDLPVFIMGGGSNLVVSDAGFAGLVLKVALLGITQRSLDAGRVRFDIAAGEDWDGFVAATVQSRFAGLECLSGIPGTIGGTPIQNVGAYGQEVRDTISEVRALHVASLENVVLSNADCQFGYRSSRFNTADRGEYVVLGVSFCLVRGGKPKITYGDLQSYFDNHPGDPTLAETREAVLEVRRRKAMVIVPGDEDSRSVGSFFKNPVISEERYIDLADRSSARGLQVPSYPAGEGRRKIPAAWLVEHAGFHKGYAKGAVGISRRHALAIVNRGGATAAEVVAFKEEIQRRVRDEFGIELQTEPAFVGF